MKKNSYEIGQALEKQVNSLLIQNGFTDSKSADVGLLKKEEFSTKATVKGKYCDWKPDFVIRTDDGAILILDAKNPDSKQPANIDISVRELVTMFFDINLNSTQYSFGTVVGDSVNVEKSHSGFTKLLEEGLRVKLFRISDFNTMLSNSSRTYN